MKYPLAIFTAAAAVVAGLVRFAVGSENAGEVSIDGASPIPRITARLVESLAYAGATDAEIADRFLLDEGTIRAEYRDTLRAARAVRRITLRGLQLELAKKLNASALTWLGRNELGQTLNPASPGVALPEIHESDETA